MPSNAAKLVSVQGAPKSRGKGDEEMHRPLENDQAQRPQETLALWTLAKANLI
jgi:hypothetical protein